MTGVQTCALPIYARARSEIMSWMDLGDLKILTDEVKGLEAAPTAFVDLLAGGNIGTRIVRLDLD